MFARVSLMLHLSNIIWWEDAKNCIERIPTLPECLGKPSSVSVNCNMF
jgi:hypothetical protein